jgi:hypothetical protein
MPPLSGLARRNRDKAPSTAKIHAWCTKVKPGYNYDKWIADEKLVKVPFATVVK